MKFLGNIKIQLFSGYLHDLLADNCETCIMHLASSSRGVLPTNGTLTARAIAIPIPIAVQVLRNKTYITKKLNKDTMMEKSHYQLPHSESNGHSFAKIVPYQPLPLSIEQEEDKSFGEFLSLLRRRGLVILGVITATMIGVSTLSLSNKPEYRGNFQLLVEPANNDESLPDVVSLTNPNLSKPGLDYATQIQVLRSPQLIKDVVKDLQLLYPDITYDNLMEKLNIARLGETKVIEVSYQNQNPEKIKAVLDKLANYYLNYSLEKQQTKLRQGTQFVEQQLPSLKQRVENLQKELQFFLQKYQFIDPQTQAQNIASEAQLLAQQRMGIDQQMILARANFINLRQNGLQVAALNDALLYQQLMTQVGQLETQISLELTRFQEDSPMIDSLKEKRDNVLFLLRQEEQKIYNQKLVQAYTEFKKLEAQSLGILQKQQQLTQKEKQLPALARKYTAIHQELTIANESLNRFLTTREILQIKTAQTELPWQLIQAAQTPKVPINAGTQRNILLGCVGGTILGIVFASLLDKLDNTYHTVDALQEKLKLPLLGTIPLDKEYQKRQLRTLKRTKTIDLETNNLDEDISSVALATKPKSTQDDIYKYTSEAFLEAFRVVNTNLQFLSSDTPIQSIVVTSALPDDGKSTVAFHLARTAAAMGQRVLLVNADMRRPEKNLLSKLNNLWGLSSLISKNMDLEQVIQAVPGTRNFFTITAGVVPPDPTKLLSSEKMRQIMSDLKQQFDLVIYDTPPLLGLADASLLARHTDGIVLVTRLERTDRSALKRTLDSLKMSRINVLGLVANGVNKKFSGYEGYYYKYF